MSVISGVMGAQAQRSAASKAAGAQTFAAQLAADTQQGMFNKSLELGEPYRQLGAEGVQDFRTADPTAGSYDIMQQLQDMPGLDLPTLDLDTFNYAFDPTDPTYQYRKGEMEDVINQAAAARGNYNSRPIINALSEGNLALTADESERQFGRALGTYTTNIDTALSQYGADYQGKTDLYNTDYGKLTDLFNMSSGLGSVDYNKIIDAIKVGQGAAGTAGAGALATGQGLANTYGQLGQGLASSNIASGQALSDMWGGIGQGNSTAAQMWMFSNMMKNPSTSLTARQMLMGV